MSASSLLLSLHYFLHLYHWNISSFVPHKLFVPNSYGRFLPFQVLIPLASCFSEHHSCVPRSFSLYFSQFSLWLSQHHELLRWRLIFRWQNFRCFPTNSLALWVRRTLSSSQLKPKWFLVERGIKIELAYWVVEILIIFEGWPDTWVKSEWSILLEACWLVLVGNSPVQTISFYFKNSWSFFTRLPLDLLFFKFRHQSSHTFAF